MSKLGEGEGGSIKNQNVQNYFVQIDLGGGWVKGVLDNVQNYAVFFY